MFAAANSLVTRAGAPPLRDAGLSDDTAAGRGKGHLSLFLKNFKFTPVLEAISRFCRKPEPPIASSSEFTKSVKRRSPQPMSCLEPIKLASALSPSRWTNRRRFTAQNENQRGGLIHSFSPKSTWPSSCLPVSRNETRHANRSLRPIRHSFKSPSARRVWLGSTDVGTEHCIPGAKGKSNY